eukprot:gene3991-5715_t
MFKYDVNHYGEGDDEFIDEVGPSDNSKSYNSSLMSSANGSSSSKAVLAALRALQDKIRRLEAERSQALDESSQLRHQLKNLEIDMDHEKQKENLIAQKNLQDSRNAYERLHADKSELELRLSKLEDKNKAAQRESDEMAKKIRSLEEEKHSNINKINELEHEQQRIENQIKHAQSREKDIAQTILWDNKRHEDEIFSLNSRIQSLHSELTQTCEEKVNLDKKLIELDHLVEQLLSVNDALVKQLNGKASSIRSRSVSPRRKAVVVPGIKISTKSKVSSKLPSQIEDIDQIKSLHHLYSNMAQKLTKKGKKKGKTLSKSNSVKSSVSVGSKTSRTRISTKNSSKSLSDNIKAIQTANNDSRPISRSKSRLTIPGVSFTEDRYVDDRSIHSSEYDDYLNNRDSISRSSSYLRRSISPAPSRISSSSFNNNINKSKLNSSNTNELKSVISSLEEEFESLNDQYRRLLSSVQASDSTSESVQQQAEEIVSVIQQLHRKGEQLRTLKSPPRHS